MGWLTRKYAKIITDHCFSDSNVVNRSSNTKKAKRKCTELFLADYKKRITLKHRRRRHGNSIYLGDNNANNNNNSSNSSNNNNNRQRIRVGRLVNNFARREAAGERGFFTEARRRELLRGSLLGNPSAKSSVWRKPRRSRK
jgi:hypothetical protein